MLPQSSQHFETNHSACVHAVIENPHLTDWFFCTKLSNWIQHWLYESLNAEWHWYRIEYQAHGSTHAHGCAKLKNEPGICKLVEKAAKGWAISNDITIKNIPQFQSETDKAQFLLEAEEAKSVVLKYAGWLVTTCNEAMPNDSWNLPSPHPCAVSLHNVTDLDEDYRNLLLIL